MNFYFLRFHTILIQLFEFRFEIIMKANIDSVQRVDPHKFSSIELNPHETTHFQVQYIATTAKRREALLVFTNETIGEFLFLIEGIPKKPEYVVL